VGRRREDILLREYTLDDTRAALDRLEETRADWYRVDVRRLARTREVFNCKIELKREVANKSRSLSSLKREITTRAKNKRTTSKSNLTTSNWASRTK
jgi:hypothetical protein